MIISRKIRIYPDDNQQIIINNTFDVCRFVWNKLLEHAIESFDSGKLIISNYGDIVSEYQFLSKDNEGYIFDRHSVNNVKQFLKLSFSRYFDAIRTKNIKYRKDGKPIGFPRFKSKKFSKNSYTSYHHENIHIDYMNHVIKLPCLGWVKYNPREKAFPDDWKILHITISKSLSNKYYCSICFEYENHQIGYNGLDFLINPKQTLNILGIDYSSSSLYVDSNGNKPGYPKYYRANQKRLRMLQKKLSRQQKGSVNRNKTIQQIRILHEKISNQRYDFLHKLSTSITKMFDVICVEDIDMKNMSQCLHLGKSTMDNGFGIFRNMLKYKQNRILFHLMITAEKWFPSSKTCSCCGNIKHDLTLKDRVYKCDHCGNTIDRDVNAAINLKQYAFIHINAIAQRFVDRSFSMN